LKHSELTVVHQKTTFIVLLLLTFRLQLLPSLELMRMEVKHILPKKWTIIAE